MMISVDCTHTFFDKSATSTRHRNVRAFNFRESPLSSLARTFSGEYVRVSDELLLRALCVY